MAGNIFLKEATAVILQNDNGGALTNTSGVAAATALDNRSAGNAAQNFWANFELKTANPGWGAAPTAGKSIDVYLVPAVDGTNYADVASSVPQSVYYVGSFATVLTTNNTVERFALPSIPLQPLLYKVYLVNNVGQTLSANWGLRVVTAEEQYS